MFVRVKNNVTIRPILPGRASIGMIKLTCDANTIAAESIIDPFNKRSIFVVLNLLIPVMFTGMLSDYIIHIFWSTVLGYFDPIPYRWWLVAYLSISVFYVRVWNEIPKEKCLDHKFRKQTFIEISSSAFYA